MSKRKSLTSKAAGGLWWLTKGTAKLAWAGAKLAGKGAVAGVKLAGKGAGLAYGKAKEGYQAHRQRQANRPATSEPAEWRALISVGKTKGNLGEFEQRLARDSLILAIVGKRGSGKSALGFRLLENMHAQSGRSCYVVGVPQRVLPEWMTSVQAVEQVKNGGVVLVDEGALEFGAREAMSGKNRALTQLMAVARHKDLTLVLITQNTALIDKNVLRLCDVLVFKEGSLLQERLERSNLADLYQAATEAFEHVPTEQRKRHAYVMDADFEGLVQAQLPGFWSSGVSKSRA